MSEQPTTVTVRGENSRFWCYLLWIMAGVILVASGLNGGFSEMLLVLPIVALLAVIGWAGWWYPRLEVSALGIRVVNLVREWSIPWSDFKDAENRWGLYIYTHSNRKIGVWAMPSRTGLFQNSWRDRKRKPEQEFNFDAAQSYERTAPLTFTADALNERARSIRSDADLRRRLQQSSGGIKPPVTTIVRFLPVQIASVTVLLGLSIYTITSLS